jgi:Fe-S cluster assembly scaffold protein SufB
MHYINKKKFRETLVEYQKISPDVDDKWLKTYKAYPKRKLTEEELVEWQDIKDDFIAWKKNQYEEKRLRIAEETEEQTKARLERFDIVKEELAEMYMLIIDGVLKMPEFNNVKVSYDLKQDMKTILSEHFQ